MLNLKDIGILVVDDEPAIRNILTRQLKETDAECYSADSVDQAIDILSNHSIDLIITDYQMPLQTGVDLLKYAKKNHPEITRIVITGFSTETIVQKILDIGVYGYILKPVSNAALLITIENGLRLHRYEKQLSVQKEKVENKLDSRNSRLITIMNSLHLGVMLVTPKMKIIEVNNKMNEWFPQTQKRLKCFKTIPSPGLEKVCSECPIIECLATGEKYETKRELITSSGIRDYNITFSPVKSRDNKITACLVIYDDITERLLIENDLQQAQKLESVGQLAAGIAHEINSPIQFVGDNVNFLKDSFADLNDLITDYNSSFDNLKERQLLPDDIWATVKEAQEDADLEYLKEEIPSTLSQTIDGVKRVEKIVRAMKDFSHPGEKEKVAADVNKIIQNTSTVCRNEWKYVAELDLKLDDSLPQVPCYSGELSQVILNMIVNAAHGIVEKEGENQTKLGTISISTSHNEEFITIKVADNGIGMSPEVQKKIFEPFFTTKARGKGTGQGLAISRRVIIDDHGGKLECSSEPGVGSQFTIDLPLN